eukprot:GHVU01056781.1.p1 GENE.GHVU01056781.1~~GHVU01056781.1.p1  ORF type:complete len:273 (+),score=21.15 GHVU01056781.1:180-998(+)
MPPPKIDSVTIDVQVPAPYLHVVSGMTRTAQGNLVTVQHGYFGALTDLYTGDLVHIMPLSVTGAVGLWDAASQKDILFLTDLMGYKIHVMKENGSYMHNIPTTFKPKGIDVQDNCLFVICTVDRKLYKIKLDQGLGRVGTDQLVLDQGPALVNPQYVDVAGGKVVVTNLYEVVLNSDAGAVTWMTGMGSSGSGPGEFNYVMGVQIDCWGRVIVAEKLNRRIQFLSASGDHIQYLVAGMDGKPYAVVLAGNALYVSQMSSNKLIKYNLHYSYN